MAAAVESNNSMTMNGSSWVGGTNNNGGGALRDISNAENEKNNQKKMKTRSGQGMKTSTVKSSIEMIGSYDDHDKPEFCAEYCAEIYAFLKEKELNSHPPANFLQKHSQINKKMRGILLDWLYEVHYKFRLLPETLYLTVNILDRYVSAAKSVEKKKLQLVGGTCLLLAAKVEEYRPPEVADITYIMDNAFSSSDVRQMEVDILNTLDFQLTYASHLQFLLFFAEKIRVPRDSQTLTLAMFVLESILICDTYCTYKASLLASAALYCALIYIGNYCPQELLRDLGVGAEDMPLQLGCYKPNRYEVGVLNEMTDDQMKTLEDNVKALVISSRALSLGKKYGKERFKNVIRFVQYLVLKEKK